MYWCQNIFQVTSEVTIKGVYENRYDVTILINGLPLVQITHFSTICKYIVLVVLKSSVEYIGKYKQKEGSATSVDIAVEAIDT